MSSLDLFKALTDALMSRQSVATSLKGRHNVLGWLVRNMASRRSSRTACHTAFEAHNEGCLIQMTNVASHSTTAGQADPGTGYAMLARRKTEVVEMTPNVHSIIEAILHIVTEADDASQTVTQYDIVKSLFLADRRHLNRYGRPITFDNYKAMLHGPVPDLAYDLLKEDRHAMSRHGVTALPWKRRPAPEVNEKSMAYFAPQRPVDEDILSPSDMTELSHGLTVVKSLGFGQVRKLTHEDQAYLDAWEDDEALKSFPMSYALLFDQPSIELAREVAFMSQCS